MRRWCHRRFWGLCYHGYVFFARLQKWHRETCPHVEMNKRIWGDKHCAWCGRWFRDERIIPLDSNISSRINPPEIGVPLSWGEDVAE